ncbi:hypothetical protein PQG02_02825 [Nostoc sp. UHCC 0926]|uniref:hypothetical protein n=1 Tax=unclassified Nostoc TaxID=2593658 RepID=UPI00236162EE|nr:hypothetical protein [Nostoc sp. UHCC 0926]WDD33348.1 hypothetical protein PQG02_02825 [Nostoc sp. UHCC 0926]
MVRFANYQSNGKLVELIIEELIAIRYQFSVGAIALNHPDKHIKGKALELLAVWMIRLTSLRFTKWRSRENGKGKVDVLIEIKMTFEGE